MKADHPLRLLSSQTASTITPAEAEACTSDGRSKFCGAYSP
jgi:hypothetical protein